MVDKRVLVIFICMVHKLYHSVQGHIILLNQEDRMHRISFWTLAAMGLLFTTVLGLLNHCNTSIVPDGKGIGDVWKKLYELQAQVLKGSHQNGELIRNQTAIQTQMTDLRKENEELRRNQTLLMHENGKIKTQLNKTMTILNDLKGKNEELRINQTRLQNKGLMVLRTGNDELRKNQTLLTQEYSKMHNKVNQTMTISINFNTENFDVLSLRKFYGRYGDLIKHYEVPSPKRYTTFWDMIIYSDTLH